MRNKFRLLLVEDIYLDAATTWVNLNLPGSIQNLSCQIERADSFVEAWKKIDEEERYDGLILDMDLCFRPWSMPMAFGKYPEEAIKPLWDYSQSKYLNDQGRIPTGGLWLWSWAIKRYDHKVTPTIFFTGHGDQFSLFLEPMKWNEMIYWCSKTFEARSDHDQNRVRLASREADDDTTMNDNFERLFELTKHDLLGNGQDSNSLLAKAFVRRALGLSISVKQEVQAMEKYLTNRDLPQCHQLKSILLPEKDIVNASKGHGNQDIKNDDVFYSFMGAIRSNLLSEYAFPEISEALKAVGIGAQLSEVGAIKEEDNGFSVASLFPEIHFHVDKSVSSNKEIDSLRNEINKKSHLVILEKIWGDKDGIIERIVHDGYHKLSPIEKDKKRHRTMDSISLLHKDVQEEILSAINSYEKADISADDFRDILREEDENGKKGHGLLCITRKKRLEIKNRLIELAKDKCFHSSNKDIFWHNEGIKGMLWENSNIVDFKEKLTDAIEKRRGQCFTLIQCCIGYFSCCVEVYDTERNIVYSKNLSISNSEWDEFSGNPNWTVPSGRIPVRIFLKKMASL